MEVYLKFELLRVCKICTSVICWTRRWKKKNKRERRGGNAESRKWNITHWKEEVWKKVNEGIIKIKLSLKDAGNIVEEGNNQFKHLLTKKNLTRKEFILV